MLYEIYELNVFKYLSEGKKMYSTEDFKEHTNA